jgi:N-acetylglucosaminyl-diphospho-decaprenol L-rhamnosyltransferase
MTTKLAVVVVTYSSGTALDDFLTSLQEATTAELDVVLADNGSTDGSLARAKRRAEVRVVATGGNVGYGAAANVGVTQTDTELVLVSNPDIVWRPGSLDRLVAASERWLTAAAFGPLILTPTGEIYPSARSLPSLGRGIGHAVFGWWWPSNPWTRSYRREGGAPVEGPTGWLSGSCLLLRRQAFDAVGGFDPDYFMYFEDVDLGDRLDRAGWASVYVPDAVVEHTGGHATGRDPSRMAVEHHRSASRYVSRRYAGWRWWPVRSVLLTGLWARSLLARRVRGVAEGAPPQRHA